MSRRYVFVTGTDTGVGKTLVTAALAVRLRAGGAAVHIRKPVQTGLIDDDDPRRGELESLYTDVVTRGDAEIAGALSGVGWSTGISLTLPMAPAAAAECSGAVLPTAADHARAVVDLCRNRPAFASHSAPAEAGPPHTRPAASPAGASTRGPEPSSVVLVEGAGGVLVDFGRGETIADLAAAVSVLDPDARIDLVIVARPGLGTLNHTALTCEALRVRQLPTTGVVIGSWPRDPTPVLADNRRRLSTIAPVLGALPADCGGLSPTDFRAQAAQWTHLD